MRPLSRLGGAALLATIALAAGLTVVLAHWLAPAPVAGSVAEGPSTAVSCANPGPSGGLVTSPTLYECPQLFDGREVQVAGEAIGEVLGTGRRRWLQLNDDAYAWAGPLDAHHRRLGTNTGIAVLLPVADAPRWLGGPGVQGDRLLVSGRFGAAAAEDQGGPAVIAEQVEVVAPGGPVQTPPVPRVRTVAVVLIALAGVLALLAERRHHR